MTTALLEVRSVSKSFRGLQAVRAASFEIPEGSITALDLVCSGFRPDAAGAPSESVS